MILLPAQMLLLSQALMSEMSVCGRDFLAGCEVAEVARALSLIKRVAISSWHVFSFCVLAIRGDFSDF
jgi:hypothetical protein